MRLAFFYARTLSLSRIAAYNYWEDSPLQKLDARTLFLISIFAALGCLCSHLLFYEFSFNDPDRYFHFALARDLGAGFFLDTIPNFPWLGWNESYVDKEPLYHYLISKFYLLNGTDGVYLFHLLLGFGILVMLQILFLSFCSYRSLLFLVPIAVWCSPFVYARLLFIRPHNLAIFLFAGLLVGVFRKNQKLAFTFGLLFPLAYHLSIMPLGVLALLLLIYYLGHGYWNRSMLVGIAGLFLGTLVNPYFPDNILMTWFIVQIGFNSSGSSLPLGQELIPHDPLVFLQLYAHYFAIFIAAIFPLLRLLSFKEACRTLTGALAIVGGGLLSALSISPRVEEYLLVVLVPLLAASCEQVIRNASVGQRNVWRLVAVVGLPILMVPAGWQHFARYNKSENVRAEVMETFNGLSALGKENNVSSVFHCNWAMGAYLYYLIPNANAIDVLDPTFLYTNEKEAYLRRKDLIMGMDGDIWNSLKNEFKASHFACLIRKEPGQLERNPAFRRVYPLSAKNRNLNRRSRLFVYEVLDQSFPRSITEYDFVKTDLKFTSSLKIPDRLPKHVPGLAWQRALPSSKTEAVSATRNQIVIREDREMSCYWVRASLEGTQRLGGFWLAQGGALNRVVVYGDRRHGVFQANLYKNREFGQFQYVPQSKTKPKYLYAFTCAAVDRDMALGYSIWTKEEYSQQCAQRFNPTEFGESESCFAEQDVYSR